MKVAKISFFFTIFLVSSFLVHAQKPEKLFHVYSDNFYEVEKNKFYRSKQLSAERLCHYIKRFRIKTIINLRGKNPDAKWWRQERKVAQQFGVMMYDIPMSAKCFPSKKNLLFLLNLYEHACRPILIHCHSGADRTGEAAALWVLDQQKKSQKDALRQLTFRYGYIRLINPKKHLLIKRWQGRKWAQNEYEPNK